MNLQRRKRIRLSLDSYRIKGAVFSISVATAQRVQLFANASFAQECIRLLKACSERAQALVYAYCFMPDHFHLLVGPGKKKGVVEFAKDYKSLATRLSWQYGYGGTVFQRSFHDHALRAEEDVEAAAQYILENPVRAGLVLQWQDYPYCGSFVYELGGRARSPAPTVQKSYVGEEPRVLPAANGWTE